MEKKILFLACCLFLINESLGSPTSDIFRSITVKKCGKSILPPLSPDRIVGGRNVRHGQHPWMISIHEEGYDHICGGSILNEDWIITAAHCIFNASKPSLYVAYAGLYKQSDLYASTVQKIRISEIIMHEDYVRKTFDNDIALLKTAKPINIAGSKGYINGICLPTSNKDPTGYAKVTGWGRLYEKGETSDTLKEVVVPIVPRDVCNDAYDRNPNDDIDEITENMICAGMQKRDSCQYDSGGPLIQTNSDGVSTLIGIVSYGIGCGEKAYPGVYTKVSLFTEWMESIVHADYDYINEL